MIVFMEGVDRSEFGSKMVYKDGIQWPLRAERAIFIWPHTMWLCSSTFDGVYEVPIPPGRALRSGLPQTVTPNFVRTNAIIIGLD